MLACIGGLVGLLVAVAAVPDSGNWLVHGLATAAGAYVGHVLDRTRRRPMVEALVATGWADGPLTISSDVEGDYRRYRAKLDAAPDNSTYWITLAGWLDAHNRNDLAAALVDEALLRWPDDSGLLTQRAWVTVVNDPSSPLAEEHIQQAEQAGGKAEYLADTRAWRLHLVNDDEAAWRVLERGALSLAIQHPVIAYHAAAIRFALRDYRGARRYVERSLSLPIVCNSTDAAEELLAKLRSYDELGV